MESSIPLLHRVRLLAVYSRLVLVYNVAIAALGTSTLLALRAAGIVGEAEASPAATLRFAVVMAGMIVATAGHWGGVLVAHSVHRSEYALYRAGGWGRVELWLASWAVSFVVGAAILVAGAI
ncbi:MAG: hypothetical protein ACOC2Y_10010 [Spirochaetota bacterium]